MSSIYTGREIAIFTDLHGLLEPFEAIMCDIKRRGINEIYSLGDNIGVGPSPCEVIDMLDYYNIKSVAGNGEEYFNLGVTPYICSFDSAKMINHYWTLFKLDDRRLDYIRNFPHSFDLTIGGKKIGLCHFANDIRTDYMLYGCDEYYRNYCSGDDAYKQFFYTNSSQHITNINYNIEKYGYDNPYMKGYVSARDYPIFAGKTVDNYDVIIQGHLHRNLYDKGRETEFYSIRAVALHFDNDPIDMAFYVILREKVNNQGFDIEKVYVPFDRESMIKTINYSGEPTGRIKKMVRML